MAIDGADELAVCVGAKIADPSGAACVDLLRDLALRRLDLAQRYVGARPCTDGGAKQGRQKRHTSRDEPVAPMRRWGAGAFLISSSVCDAHTLEVSVCSGTESRCTKCTFLSKNNRERIVSLEPAPDDWLESFAEDAR